MSGHLAIRAAGPGTTLQDGGRHGYLRYGVGAAGPMDWIAHIRANILAGNPENAGAIEVGLGGIELQAEGGEIYLGYAGAPFAVTLNGQALPTAGRVRLGLDDRFAVKAGARGAWFYVSPAGGFDVAQVMGSLSTSLRSGIGGLNGRALAAGDRLALRGGPTLPELGFEERAPARTGPLRVLLGPQDDYFSPAGIRTFFAGSYKLSARSDRMGYRFEGPAVEHAKGFNIVSDGIALGAIQIPGDGKPIVLMADRQSTGGYPKLGCVIRADIGRLAQCRAGDATQFESVAVEAARAELFAGLRTVRASLAAAFPLGGADLSSEFLLSQNLISGAQSAAEET
jgi:5-oxoprolinase (ATP-hydrolysing) subunit C